MENNTRKSGGSRRSRLVLAIAVVAALLVPAAAMAGAGFDDVDAGSVFVADIEWLADTGVTLGCNPPDNTNFCPKDNVLREQMAAFMRRLATNRIVDAGELNGRTASDISTSAGATYSLSNFCFPLPCTPTNPVVSVPVNSNVLVEPTDITFDAPTAGYLLINASTSVSCGSGGLLASCGDPDGTVYIAVDGINYSPAPYALYDLDGARRASVSNTAYVAVSEGEVDVAVRVFNFDDGSAGSVTSGGITIQFVPYNAEVLGFTMTLGVSDEFIQAEQAAIEAAGE
jgi:hypothetical protein